MQSDPSPDESAGAYALQERELERQRWRTLAIAGGVVALIGVLAVAFPVAASFSIALAIGAMLVVVGIVHGAHAIGTRGWSGRIWQLVLAIVSIVAGLFVLAEPAVGLVSLTILAIAYLLADGVAELWMARRLADQPGRSAIAVSGALSLVLAGMLWVGFPVDAAWAIGLLVGVSLVLTGMSMLAVASAERKFATDDVTPPATKPRRA